MKPAQMLCHACIVGLLAAAGSVNALERDGVILAATEGAPPVNSPPGMPGRPDAPRDTALPKADTGVTAAPAPSTDSAKKPSDSAITMKVKAELLATKGLKSTGIKVKTENGVVHLDGKVPSENDRMAALKAARAIEGVSSVSDGLQVGK